MTTDELYRRVVGVLRAECPKLATVGEITCESRLQADLELDSADAIAIIGGLEDEFGMRLEDEDAAMLETVGDVVQYIGVRVARSQDVVAAAE